MLLRNDLLPSKLLKKNTRKCTQKFRQLFKDNYYFERLKKMFGVSYYDP